MKIAFLGLGLMGRPMAERLIRAGHSLIVYNRTRGKALPLEKLGAQVAAGPAEAITSAPVSIFMVVDGGAVRNLLFPPDVPKPNLSGRTIIQMSTISPADSLALKKDVEVDGGEYLEAPVLGGPGDADKGGLAVLAGAWEEQFRKWGELFKVLSPAPVLCGPVPSGAVVKLALNHLIAAETASFSLSLGLISRHGIDPGIFMGVLRNSALYASQFDKKLDRMMTRNFETPTFSERNLLKDIRLALSEARGLGLETAALEGLERILIKASEAGWGDLDYSALYNAVNPERP